MVVLMRKAQKEYFKTRSQTALRNSKSIEAEIDREIDRVCKLVNVEAQLQQIDLFND